MQIGNHRDAQAAKGGAVSAVNRQLVGDNRNARRFDPKGIDAERDGEASQKSENDARAPPVDQNLIRARESSDTALVPVWPPKFI
jgi:hypothetical protein